MSSIVGALLFGIIAIMEVLLIFGAPLGEFTMGGQNKVLHGKWRGMAAASLFIQIFAILIILQAGGRLPLWFTETTTKRICIFFGAFLSLNTVMNLISPSKKEKCVMTPLSLIAAICYFVTGLL